MKADLAYAIMNERAGKNARMPRGKKMYRPKDWKNPYKDCIGDDGSRLTGYDSIFEAGADAILGALASQEHQNWLATPEGESCSGKWVFIPND